LLMAVQAVITDAHEQDRNDLHGKALFDAIDQRCGGGLLEILGELAQHDYATNPRPYPVIEEGTPEEVEEKAAELSPVILPHIWLALTSERDVWQSGQEWNSCLRVAPYSKGGEQWAFYVTDRLHYGGKKQMPLTLLDATPPPKSVLEAIFKRKVSQIHEVQAPPPASMRHLAVRTGARYGITSLTAKGLQNRDITRAIAQARYLLNQVDPDGDALAAGRVGLITFMECEQYIAEVLGIPYSSDTKHPECGRTAHYYGQRGTNHLEDCSILLVIGTPWPPPHEVVRLARAVYRDDSIPLDETIMTDDADHFTGYVDPRLQVFARWLSESELSQAAHRCRPLRHENRTVITMASGEVAYLPVTTEVKQLPTLTLDGENKREVSNAEKDARLEYAFAFLEEHGRTVTVDALRLVAQVRKAHAVKWLKSRREDALCSISKTVPNVQIVSISHSGTDLQILHKRPDAPLPATPGHINRGAIPSSQVWPLPQEQAARTSYKEGGAV
jgi:hypothetical protein